MDESKQVVMKCKCGESFAVDYSHVKLLDMNSVLEFLKLEECGACGMKRLVPMALDDRKAT